MFRGYIIYDALFSGFHAQGFKFKYKIFNQPPDLIILTTE